MRSENRFPKVDPSIDFQFTHSSLSADDPFLRIFQNDWRHRLQNAGLFQQQASTTEKSFAQQEIVHVFLQRQEQQFQRQQQHRKCRFHRYSHA